MNHLRKPAHRLHRAISLRTVALLLLPSLACAQACPGFGSTPVSLSILAGPVPACASSPQWPCWHLVTPAHRAPAPHAGFTPGNARELPRLLVTYRCTGLLLVPVVPTQLRTMGYVVDQPEFACEPATARP